MRAWLLTALAAGLVAGCGMPAPTQTAQTPAVRVAPQQSQFHTQFWYGGLGIYPYSIYRPYIYGHAGFYPYLGSSLYGYRPWLYRGFYGYRPLWRGGLFW